MTWQASAACRDADHVTPILQRILDVLELAPIITAAEAVRAESRRRICPVDGCLTLPDEDCPACRLARLFVVCAGCGTLAHPDFPCRSCAALRAKRRAA